MSGPDDLDNKPKGLGSTPDAAQEGGEEEFEFDGTDVDEGFSLVNEGRHPAVVIDFQKDQSEAGNDMYVWEFQIVAGPDKGETIRDWTSLLPQARWKVADYLEACGISDARGSIAKFTKSDVVDSAVVVEVEHTMRDGDEQNDVADVYAPDDETKNAVEKYVSGEGPSF